MEFSLQAALRPSRLKPELRKRLKGAKNNLQPVEGKPRPNGALENEAYRKETSMDAALAFA
ncbi:MAG: hypothetical protein DMG08_00410, partial [Acidobacteria bacterium]